MVAGLVAVSMLAWFVLGLVTTDPQPRTPDVLGGPAPSSPPPRAGDDPTDGDGDQPADDGDEPAGDADEPADDEPADDGDEPADDGDDAAEEPPEPVTIDFDGVCTVEIHPGQRTSDLRPWNFEACERAPIELRDAQTRWIVVLESLAGSDFSETEALARAGDGQQLLWSGHYPSLNPDLWVVVDGPFEDRRVATDAAGRHGGGAYPRELSDDAGDRYCVAADGCIGETGG